MPTRSKRVLRRMRRQAYVIWALATLIWIPSILWSQQPWRGLDQLQLTLWTLIGVTGVLVGGLQQRGKDYWPANLLLGCAAGAPSVMYVAFVQLVFHNDVGAFGAWAREVHLAIWAWGSCLLLMYWSLYLVVRVNRAKSGGSIGLGGATGPPTEEQVLEAAHTLTRGINHGLGNLLLHQEFTELVSYMRRPSWVNPNRARRLAVPGASDVEDTDNPPRAAGPPGDLPGEERP